MFDFLFKNKLSGNWKSKRKLIEDEFIKKENELVASLTSKYAELELSIHKNNEAVLKKTQDLEELEKRVLDRRAELERANEELKTQIRLIEAKASPSNIWESSFTLGFSKAWDMMLPVMSNGLEKVKENIRNNEIEESFTRIDLVTEQKIEKLREKGLAELHKIDSKLGEFRRKLANAKDDSERQKYANFISVLEWVLERRNGN